MGKREPAPGRPSSPRRARSRPGWVDVAATLGLPPRKTPGPPDGRRPMAERHPEAAEHSRGGGWEGDTVNWGCLVPKSTEVGQVALGSL